MKKKISIIIPVYNAEKYIGQCIENILNQTYNDYEIIIVDDGSKDNTKNIAINLAEKHDSIKFFRNHKKGVSSARNLGLFNSNGEYIVFIDVDDIISPAFLKTLVDMMEYDDNDCAIVSYTTKKEELSFNGMNDANIVNVSDIKYKLLTESKYNVGGYIWNKIYKKSILDKYNIIFDEKILVCEDLLFNSQYFEKSKRIVYKNVFLYYYKLNSNSAVNKIENAKWFDAIEVYGKLCQMNFESDVHNSFKFLYAQVILEALYRVRFCKNAPYSKDELLKLKKNYTKLSFDYSFVQNLKIVLFKIFPNIAMKYKRKSIKEN